MRDKGDYYMSPKYVARVNAFIEPYLSKHGFSLIRTDFTEEDHNWYLRLYIDLTEEEAAKRAAEAEEERKAAEENRELTDAELVAEALGEAEEEKEEIPEPGININDCAKVSRYLSKWLDKEDFISEAYTLEVCSRGFLPQE